MPAKGAGRGLGPLGHIWDIMGYHGNNWASTTTAYALLLSLRWTCRLISAAQT
jgi:hypothetical protein